MQLFVKKLTETAIVPTKSYCSDAGYDLYADEDAVIYPGQTVKVKTGIAIAPSSIVDSGFETVANLIWDRSGLGSKGIHRLAGVIDFSYRGEILVCLTNLNLYNVLTHVSETQDLSVLKQALELNKYVITRGDRIAQILPQKVLKVELVETADLFDSERGTRGFGSSGV